MTPNRTIQKAELQPSFGTVTSMNFSNYSRWYVIYTKTNEEDRADRNLAAWGLETFYPRIKKKQVNEFTGKAIYFSRPLFPRYIFARFDAETLLRKVCNSRGVQKVLNIDYVPVPVAD